MSDIMPHLDSMRILHIDDTPNDRKIVKLSLERIGPEMDIVSAASLTESLRMMEELQIDCSVCDNIMPEMNGIALCRRIRETSDVPSSCTRAAEARRGPPSRSTRGWMTIFGRSPVRAITGCW